MSEELLVTDTHPLIFFFCDGGRRLSKRARAAFQDAASGKSTAIFVPAPVLAEVSMLVQDRAIRLNKPFADWVADLFAYPMINPVPFDHETVICCHDLRFHSDPFDRAIVATALRLSLPLITNDSKIHETQPCVLFWD